MPTYLEVLVEGERRGVLNDEQEAILETARTRGLAPARQDRGFLSRVERAFRGTADEAVHGMLLNSGVDEVVRAAGRYVGGQIKGAVTGDDPQSFGEQLTEIRTEREARRRDSPVVSTVAGVVGSLGIGGPLAKGTQLAAQGISRAAPNLAAATPRLLRAPLAGAAVGAPVGAVAGFGETEGGIGERLSGAATGAAVGGSLGAVTPAVVATARGIGRGGYAVGRAIGDRFRSPQTAAEGMVRRAFSTDQVTPAQARTRLQALGREATVADIGNEDVTSLAARTAGVRGTPTRRASSTMQTRSEGRSQRVGQTIRTNVSPRDYFSSQDEFLTNLRTRADPLYKRAYAANQSVMTPEINRVLNTPSGRLALRGAAKLMADDATLLGRRDPGLTAALREARDLGLSDEVTGVGVSRGLRLQTLDYVKRALDDMITKAYRAGSNNRGRILTGLKNRLLTSLDNADRTGAYARARAQYGGDASVLEALESGRGFMKMQPEEITQAISELDRGGQRAFKAGAARALRELVEGTADSGDAVQRIFGTNAVRARLRAVMNPSEYRDLARTLTAERRFRQTERAVIRGSGAVQPRAEIDDDLRRGVGNLGAVIGSNVGSRPLIAAGIGRQVGQRMLDWVSGAAPSAELARMLFSRNQSANLGTIDRLVQQPEAKRQATGALVGANPAIQEMARRLGLP